MRLSNSNKKITFEEASAKFQLYTLYSFWVEDFEHYCLQI